MRKNNAGKSKAVSYAYRLFSARPRSEKELRDRLFRKGFGRAVIYDVISLLKEKNIIDDFKFAKLWVESRMRANPRSDALLRNELRMKGVSAAVIEKVLSERETGDDSLARALAGRRLESLEKLPKEKARKKLFDFLARRGFDFDVIEDTVKETLGVK
ncbi:MAG: regulatory protein RecX [Candidatus Omnitrophota bacterium]|nr:MAG: regulatory protein RecX [Candidatus Omnitrophota bacterium]